MALTPLLTIYTGQNFSGTGLIFTEVGDYDLSGDQYKTLYRKVKSWQLFPGYKVIFKTWNDINYESINSVDFIGDLGFVTFRLSKIASSTNWAEQGKGYGYVESGRRYGYTDNKGWYKGYQIRFNETYSDMMKRVDAWIDESPSDRLIYFTTDVSKLGPEFKGSGYWPGGIVPSEVYAELGKTPPNDQILLDYSRYNQSQNNQNQLYQLLMSLFGRNQPRQRRRQRQRR